MQVDFNPNINFTSRNYTIRKADDFARKIRGLYPMISSTKLETMPSAKKYPNVVDNLSRKIRRVREAMDFGFKESTEMTDKLRRTIYPISVCTAGNCGESAILGAVAAKVNGFKNCYIAGMHGEKYYPIDHAVLYVNEKKPYIIDPWIGFADYVPQAINRYKSEFSNFFGDETLPDKIEFMADLSKMSVYINDIQLPFKIRAIKREFPELIV